MLRIDFNLLSRKNFRAIAVLGLLLGTCAALAAAPTWAIDAAEWVILNQGNVVVKQSPTPANGSPSVEAKILIAKPPEKVWSVVADPEKLMRYEKKVKKVKIISRSGNKQNVAFTVLMTHLLPAFDYVLEQNLTPPTALTFHRISGSFKDIQGSWKLQPVDNGQKTVLTYTLKIDPGPLVPRSLLLPAVKSDLPSMMKNAKAAIDRGPN